jgi:signal transduction histidine kinase
MVEKAKAFYAKQGEEKALEAFSAKDGGFIDGDLYIFVVGYDGVTMANGGNSSLLGRQVATLKDADGKFFIKEMIDLSKAKGAGWIDYKWRIPSTGEIKEKTSYIEAAGEMFIGCGIYK